MPATFILAHAVLQVKHGIFLIRCRLIFRRSINIATAHLSFHRRIILALTHLPMGNILVIGIIGRVLRFFRNLYAARHAPATIETIRGRIGHLHSIHQKEIIMEAHHQRVGRHRPHAFGVFLHRILLPADVGHHRLCLGGFQLEYRPALCVHFGIFGHRYVIHGTLCLLGIHFRHAILPRHGSEQGASPHHLPLH